MTSTRLIQRIDRLKSHVYEMGAELAELRQIALEESAKAVQGKAPTEATRPTTPSPTTPSAPSIPDLKIAARPAQAADLAQNRPAPSGPTPAKKPPVPTGARSGSGPGQRPPSGSGPRPPRPAFFDRNRNLEKFIGENLVNKVGIGVLVLGIAFFVKYAIDHAWINEVGRVLIGLASGSLLLGFAHRLRKTYKAFSSVLVGGGLASFYFTISIAFQQYGLMSQGVAFATMIAITAFSVLLSIGYDRQELAVLSLLGGFATPLMVSTGTGNYIVLFTYLTILNAGLLVLAYFKQWRLVNILAYVLTVAFFGSWVANHILSEASLPYRNALLFATGFYLLFFGSNVAYNLRTRGTFRALDISLLLSNTALFYAVGMHCFHHLGNGQFQGLFTVSMAALQFAIVLPLYRRKAVDKNLLYLLIGLVLTFLSLAVPVQLKGHVITLFWSVEAVLLLWMFQRTKIPVLRLGTVVVTILTMISLVMDWNQIYGLLRHASDQAELLPLFNRGFVTGTVTAITLWMTRFLLQRTPIGIDFLDIRASDYRSVIGLLFAGTLFFTGLLELRYQLLQFVADVPTRNVVMISYLLAFLLVAMGYESRHANAALRSVLTVFGGILLLLFPLINWEMVLVRNHFVLDQGATLAGFLYHYVVLALMVTIGWVTLQRMPAVLNPKTSPRKPGLWVAVLAALYLLSAELDHLVVWGLAGADNLSYVLRQNHKIGFPILWGISSFALMVYGMRHHWRSLRIISLTLFLVTLIKLFAVDLQGISEAGKIASFVSLGLLLLVISFLYQKLKALIWEDEPNA